MRDMLRRKIRERLLNPSQRRYNYKYETELEFMIPFYKESVAENLNNQEDYTEFFDADEENITSYNVEESSVGIYESDHEISDPKDVKPTLPINKRKRTEELEVTSLINDAVESVSQELNPTDPLDGFLLTIGATLRTLTPYYLNQAKSKIFAVVQEYELKQIVDKGGHPPNVDSGS